MKAFIIIIIACLMFSSCATILNPASTSYQKTKPTEGQPQREIKTNYVLLDIILFPLGLVLDFATGSIYKEEPTK